MLQRLYDILMQFREYAVLAGLLAASLILLALNDNVQLKRLRSMATITYGLLQEQVIFIPRYFSLESENRLLRRTNIQLADEANRLREAKLENLRLRELLKLREQTPFDIVAAEVIGKNLTLLRNTLTIDLGEADGIKPMMPVIGDGGLVGLVVSVSRHYAIVNLALNVDFRASGKIERSRVDGIIAWDGKNLVFKNVAKTLDVKVGDVVLTSSYSSTFPPDIRVGVVRSVEEHPGTLFKSITLSPGVDFVKLEEVFVLTALPDSERVSIERRDIVKPAR
ncbi:MAG TPA: rod shape-determining protein MreC [Bacteroidota bacterium]